MLFNYNHMENIFEIGRYIQNMVEDGCIEIEDSKEAFDFALDLAVKFEEKYPETENYYCDLDEFIVPRIMEHFSKDDE